MGLIETVEIIFIKGIEKVLEEQAVTSDAVSLCDFADIPQMAEQVYANFKGWA